MSNRSFKVGRQSEQLLNEDLYKIYESIATLLKEKEVGKIGPKSDSHGALWLDQEKNDMYSYDKNNDQWNILFKERFQMFEDIMSPLRPEDPVYGQLWINRGVLWYFDNDGWKQVYAQDPDSLGALGFAYEDFVMLSPLSKKDNQVVADGEERYQFLVPDSKIGRAYLENTLLLDHIKESDIAIQYPREKMKKGEISWVHVDPRRISSIKKYVIRIDPATNFYEVPTFQTELFGFKVGNPLGDCLQKGSEDFPADYYSSRGGVELSDKVVDNYDYLLVVNYSFGSSSQVGHVDAGYLDFATRGVYLDRHIGEVSSFLEGFAIDGHDFSYDGENQIVQSQDSDFEDDEKFELNYLLTKQNEYGYIRQLTVDERSGIIKPRKHFIDPLVIVGGQAMIAGKDFSYSSDNEHIIIEGAGKGMGYTIIELDKVNGAKHITGVVPDADLDEEGYYIRVKNLAEWVSSEEGLILFVNGILVDKKEIKRDYASDKIRVDGLDNKHEYLLIHDPQHDLYSEEDILDSYTTNEVDESVVFMNGKIIANSASIMNYTSLEDLKELKGTFHNEVRLFVHSRKENGQYLYECRVWNEFTQKWLDKIWIEKEQRWINTNDLIEGLLTFCFSYENGIRSIALRLPHSEEDEIFYWAYKYAHAVVSPTLIYHARYTKEEMSELWKESGSFDEFGKPMVKIPTAEKYPYGANALQVYFDGVRQYDSNDFRLSEYQNAFKEYGIKEAANGDGFFIRADFVGNITYVIERPEKRKQFTCKREILTIKDKVDNTMPTYKTELPLFPGVVTLYINGLRQSRSSYVIIDSNTIMFKEGFAPNGHNRHGEEIDKHSEDLILIEVRDDHSRTEKFIRRPISISDATGSSRNLIEFNCDTDNISYRMLDTKDEVMIYIDGLFAGYRNKEEYRIDGNARSLVVLSTDFLSAIYNDPLYIMLAKDSKARARYEKKYGPIDDRAISNDFIIEWR